MGFANVIDRTYFLNQSHLDRAEMTCLLDWVTPGSTLTALDGRTETTDLREKLALAHLVYYIDSVREDCFKKRKR